MSNFKEMKDGYTNLINHQKEIEILAHNRNLICDPCPSNSKNKSTMGAMLPYCTECGCLLAAKTRSPDSECPLKKW